MNTKKDYKKQDPNALCKCVRCSRIYTLHMMMQINEWAKRYKCIKCYNEGEKKNGKENDIHQLLS